MFHYHYNITLKSTINNSEIDIPLTRSITVILSGLAFDITPGKLGALMKSQILKISSGIPRTKTAPIVLVEKVYDLISAILASIVGIIILGIEPYLIVIAILVLSVIFFFIYYIFFNRFNNILIVINRTVFNKKSKILASKFMGK